MSEAISWGAFEAIVWGLDRGVVVVDRHGLMLYMNEHAGHLFEVAPREVLGRPLSSIRGELEAMGWSNGAGELLLLPTPEESEAGGGEARVIGFNTRRVEGGEGEGEITVSVFSDISAEITRRREDAHRRRLADIGTVAASMAHEIRNPIFAITTLVSLLRGEDEVETNPELSLLCEKIRDEALRVARLIDDLLGFSRERELELRQTDLVALGREVVEEVGMRFRQDASPPVAVRLEVASRLGESLPWTCDRSAMRQVLTNLTRNAVQAVLIREQRTQAHGVTVRIDTWDDRWAEFVISDEGVGLSDHDRENMFQAFFTKRPDGTGLGLAVVARLVEQHKGTVNVESVLGEGTQISVRLPPA